MDVIKKINGLSNCPKCGPLNTYSVIKNKGKLYVREHCSCTESIVNPDRLDDIDFFIEKLEVKEKYYKTLIGELKKLK